MATTTQNLGLIKPAGTDKIRIAQINSNMDTIDTKMGPVGSTPLQTQATNAASSISALQRSMAIICNGNTHAAIAEGRYAYVRNHSSLSEGLYQATAAISANATLSASNLSAVSGGGLNALNGGLNRLAAYVTLYDNQNGIFYDETATLSEAITNFRYLLLVFRTNGEYATQLIPTDTIPVGRSINQSFLEHNVPEGKVTYPLAYSTSANYKITSATTIKCTMQVYSDVNLKARLVKVIGIGRIN